jgi:hypothetical protein
MDDWISGGELHIDHLNAIGMKKPFLHIFSLTKFDLRYGRRAVLVWRFNFERTLANLGVASIVSQNILHKSGDVFWHCGLLTIPALSRDKVN